MRLNGFFKGTKLLLLGAVWVISGCAVVSPPTNGTFKLDFKDPKNNGSYLLRPGDRLSITCMAKVKDTVEYKLEVGDQVSVQIADREDLSRSYLVAPDGSIQFTLLDPIQVQGISLSALRKNLEEGYANIISHSKIAVGLLSFNTQTMQFVNALRGNQFTSSVYESVIDISGKANFPLIGFIKLSGLNMEQANDLVTKAYQTSMPHLDVTLKAISSQGQTVTVLGEVNRPGTFEISGGASLITIIGMAGGYNYQAKMNSVVTVQPRGGQVYVNRYDLENDIIAASQINLGPGDFIIVPRSVIGDVNAFVDQYIRRNLPINVGVSASYGVTETHQF